jgi:hypothetical protein
MGEGDLTPVPGTLMGEGDPTPALGTPSDEGGLAPTSEANSGTLVGPIGLARELGAEIAAITEQPAPNMDWQKSILEYLQLETVSNDETKTQRLARRAKGYLIHNSKLYHRSISGTL